MKQKAPQAHIKVLATVAAGLGALTACSQFDQPTPRYWEVREIVPPITAVEVAPQLGQPTFTAGGPPVYAGQAPSPRPVMAPLPVQMGGDPMVSGPFGDRDINHQYRMGSTQAPDVVSSGAYGVAPRLPTAPVHVYEPGAFQQLTTDSRVGVYGGTYPLMQEVSATGSVQAAGRADAAEIMMPPPAPPGAPMMAVPQTYGSIQHGPLPGWGTPAPALVPTSNYPPTIQLTGQPLVMGAPVLGTGQPMRSVGYLGQRDYESSRMQATSPMPAAGFLDPSRDPARAVPQNLDGVRPLYPVDPRMAGGAAMPAGGARIVPSIAGAPMPHPQYGVYDPYTAGDAAVFKHPAQPVAGTMQGLLTAPTEGPGALGSSFIDPTTGHPRDFRHVILTPETMDPRNVNRRALDRLSAMSLRGYSVEKTIDNGAMRPPASTVTTGMTGARAAPYWRMIADDIAEQIFTIQPPGNDFFYIEPATQFRNRVADNIFRDMLAKALRQRGVQVAPSPEYATALVRIKVDMFDLNPLGWAHGAEPPDYTPLLSQSGRMMLVLDRGIAETRGADLNATNSQSLGFPSLGGVDPFMRPFTGIMASGIVERRGKSAYRVHGAYYIDRKDI